VSTMIGTVLALLAVALAALPRRAKAR
jgi:hypothetical protein